SALPAELYPHSIHTCHLLCCCRFATAFRLWRSLFACVSSEETELCTVSFLCASPVLGLCVVLVFNLILIKLRPSGALHHDEVMNKSEPTSLRSTLPPRRLPSVGIAQKIGVVFLALLLIAAVNIVLVDSLTRKSDSVADTVNVAGKLRMLGQRIALQAVSSTQGVGAGEIEVRHLISDFESVLSALANGGYVFGLYIEGLSPLHKGRIDAVHDQWSVYRQAVLRLTGEIARQRGAAELAGVVVAPVGVDSMVEEVVSHSARLLERAEALMSGILTDVQLMQSQVLNRMYLLLAVDALLILLAFMAVRRQIVVPLRELSTHCVELARGNYNTRFQVSTQD